MVVINKGISVHTHVYVYIKINYLFTEGQRKKLGFLGMVAKDF